MNIGNNLQQNDGNAVLSTGKSDTKYSKAINLTIQKKKKQQEGGTTSDTDVNAVHSNWKNASVFS